MNLQVMNLTDDQLRELWKGYGGHFSSPHSGMGYMTEDKLFPFLRGLIERGTTLFHQHLDLCEQCRNNPMGLCKAGALALRLSAEG